MIFAPHIYANLFIDCNNRLAGSEYTTLNSRANFTPCLYLLVDNEFLIYLFMAFYDKRTVKNSLPRYFSLLFQLFDYYILLYIFLPNVLKHLIGY